MGAACTPENGYIDQWYPKAGIRSCMNEIVNSRIGFVWPLTIMWTNRALFGWNRDQSSSRDSDTTHKMCTLLLIHRVAAAGTASCLSIQNTVQNDISLCLSPGHPPNPD